MSSSPPRKRYPDETNKEWKAVLRESRKKRYQRKENKTNLNLYENDKIKKNDENILTKQTTETVKSKDVNNITRILTKSENIDFNKNSN